MEQIATQSYLEDRLNITAFPDARDRAVVSAARRRGAFLPLAQGISVPLQNGTRQARFMAVGGNWSFPSRASKGRWPQG